VKALSAVVLKPGREKPVRQRHPWLFSGAVARIEGSPADGDLVEVRAADGSFLARGYFNRASQIVVRLLTWDPEEPVDAAFWQRRLERAIRGRAALAADPTTTAYRLVHAEADGLPGLIVDRYGDWLVLQALTLGIERRKRELARWLAGLVDGVVGIYERSDVDVRAKEGLEPATGTLWGEPPPDRLVIREKGFRFWVDLRRGHKTGFYLDQRENRARLPPFCADAEVLNAFAYTGAFAVYAAAGGAAQIVNLDTSGEALALAREQMALNGFHRPQDEYVEGDAFQVLRRYRDAGRTFDVVILDPPKFAFSRRHLERASRGYKDINWLGMRLLRPGGILFTFSCSGLVSEDLFQKILFAAALDAGREVQIVGRLSQGSDHPILLTFPESAYLKGFICRVW